MQKVLKTASEYAEKGYRFTRIQVKKVEGGGVPPQAARVEVGAVGLEMRNFAGAGALGFTSFHLVVWSPNFY